MALKYYTGVFISFVRKLGVKEAILIIEDLA